MPLGMEFGVRRLPSMRELLEIEYDLAVGSCGFEKRSTFLIRHYAIRAKRKVAYAFEDRRVLNFERNAKHYQRNGWLVETTVDAEAASALDNEMQLLKSDEDVRILIDISSMTRRRIAAAVETICTAGSGRRVIADFIYCPPEFRKPETTDYLIETLRPVSGFFTGWNPEAYLPRSLVLGIGYEMELAVGIREALEVDCLVVFLPMGGDEKFEKEVRAANATLLTAAKEENIVEYSVENPLEAFMFLEGTIEALARESRPTIVPLGPKIFALISLLVGAKRRDVGVWRASSGPSGEAFDREGDGRIVGLRVASRGVL